MTDEHITLRFGRTKRFGRTNITGEDVTGEDVARRIREAMPDADVRAEFDERGAVAAYTMTLVFPDADAAMEAALGLRDFFVVYDLPVEFS